MLTGMLKQKLAPGFAGIIKSVGEAVTMLGGVPVSIYSFVSH